MLYDAVTDPGFCRTLLDAIGRRRTFRAESDTGAQLTASRSRVFRVLRGPAGEELPVRTMGAEQSNSSVVFGDRLVLKLFRKLEPGVNPDLEIGRFLTEKTTYRHVPPVGGALELVRRNRPPLTVAILQGYVESSGDAWRFTLSFLGRFFERVLSRPEAGPPPAPADRSGRGGRGEDVRPAELAWARSWRQGQARKPEGGDRGPDAGPHPAGLADPAEPTDEVAEIIGLYPTTVALLGRRTAELHLALASDREDPAFVPEPFSELYQRSLYQSLRSSVGRTFRQLKKGAGRLPEGVDREAAKRLLASREALLSRFEPLLAGKIEAERIRCHGDYHLGQVLHTGKDFVILDFEGEPARPLSERRIKRSPLRDVAGMLRSFDYAVHASLEEQRARALLGPEQVGSLESWGRRWYLESAGAFLGAYLETVQGADPERSEGGARIVPPDEASLGLLLEVYLLDKAIYELRYELDNRPEWARIPLAGILGLIDGGGGAG